MTISDDPAFIARRERYRAATRKAKDVLKPGDRLRITRCGGGLVTVTMTGWDGDWITSAKYDDIAAASIRKLNGQPIKFDEVN